MLEKIKNLKSLIGNTFSTTSTRSGGEFLLRETDFGTIHADSNIIRQMVESKHVEGVQEIRNIVIEVPTEKNLLNIKLNLVIGQSYSAPVIGAKLRDAIREDLRTCLTIDDALFDIRVTQINQSVPEKKKRRVR